MYRSYVIGCALSWFMAGLSLAMALGPETPGRLGLWFPALWAVIGIADLWALLRGFGSWKVVTGSQSSAT